MFHWKRKGLGPIRHVGYRVESIPKAVEELRRGLGAGPFFSLGAVRFEFASCAAGPAVFDHTPAFGKCGDTIVELQEIRRLEPEVVRAALGRPPGAFNHLAYFAADPEAKSAELAAAGLPFLLHAKDGPVEVTFNEVPALGCTIELHKDTEFIRAAHAAIHLAGEDWDGSEPLRAMAGLPMS